MGTAVPPPLLLHSHRQVLALPGLPSLSHRPDDLCRRLPPPPSKMPLLAPSPRLWFSNLGCHRLGLVVHVVDGVPLGPVPPQPDNGTVRDDLASFRCPGHVRLPPPPAGLQGLWGESPHRAIRK